MLLTTDVLAGPQIDDKRPEIPAFFFFPTSVHLYSKRPLKLANEGSCSPEIPRIAFTAHGVWSGSTGKGRANFGSGSQSIQNTNPGADTLVEGDQLIFLVGGVDAVVRKAKPYQQ